jgi:hypothetical protein
MESSAAHQEPEPGAPDQSSVQGSADVAGTAQDGGRMVAPARTGAAAEPDPGVPLDPGAPLAEPEVALELAVPPQEHGSAPDPGFPEPEYAEPEYAGPGYTGPGYTEPEFPSRRRMGPLAVILIIVAILVVAAGVFAVVTHTFKPRTKVAYQVPAVFKLRQGDCFNSGQNDLAVTVLPCASSHDSEVFATFRLTESSWPGNTAVQAQAQAGCTDRIAGYMSPELAATSFDQEYFYPDQLAWQAGVRSVICEVRSTNGPITGSVRGDS